jgi:hypothetical protein
MFSNPSNTFPMFFPMCTYGQSSRTFWNILFNPCFSHVYVWNILELNRRISWLKLKLACARAHGHQGASLGVLTNQEPRILKKSSCRGSTHLQYYSCLLFFEKHGIYITHQFHLFHLCKGK